MNAPDCAPGDCDGGTESPAAVSTAFDLLADHRRRRLLHCLRERAIEPVELEAVLSTLAEERPGDDPAELAVEVHHVHLPKLDASGVVDYDPANGTVRYVGQPVLEACLETTREFDVET